MFLLRRATLVQYGIAVIVLTRTSRTLQIAPGTRSDKETRGYYGSSSRSSMFLLRRATLVQYGIAVIVLTRTSRTLQIAPGTRSDKETRGYYGSSSRSSMFLLRRATFVQYGIAVIVSLSALTAGAWLTWPSTANKYLLKGEACCTANGDEISTMVALMDLGNVLTPIPASYICNAYGRKPVVHATAVVFVVASLCVMFADSMVYIYVGRVLAGMGKGIAFAVIPMFLAEIAEVPIRGALGTIFTAFVSIGISYDYIFGAILNSYQGLNIANIVVPVLFGIGYLFIPESPYFLIMKGNQEKALKSLGVYRQLPINDDNLKKELSEIKESVETDMKNKARFIDVVTTKSRRRALLISSMTAFFQRLSGISPLLAFSTITLPENGGGASREIYVIIFSFLIVIGNYIGIGFVDSWGRKLLFLISTVGCAIIDAVFAVYFTYRSDSMDYDWIPYAALLCFGFFWGVGMSYIPSILVAELFPTNIKSYAGSVQSIMFALASFIANKLFGATSDGPKIMFYVFCASCLVCSAFTVLLIFETKGKTFQEIQSTLMKITGETIPDEELNIDKENKNTTS